MALGTQEKILEAAHSLFEEKGFSGVTMREISDKSGMNKGLLHYYFKSKQAIFIGVFKSVIRIMFVNISGILERTDIDFDTKIELMIDAYYGMLTKHPKLPLFVLSELSKMKEFTSNTEIPNTLKDASKLIEENLGKYKKVNEGDGFHFLINLISLCVFPFIAQPMLQVIKPNKEESYSDFLASRKSHIKNILIHAYK